MIDAVSKVPRIKNRWDFLIQNLPRMGLVGRYGSKEYIMEEHNCQNFFSVEEAEEIFEEGWDGDPSLGPECPIYDDDGNLVGYGSLL